MEAGKFSTRERKEVAHELADGNAENAASLLREDCAMMDPKEFSRLLKDTQYKTSRSQADLIIEFDGDVVVQAKGGTRYNAGKLPQVEIYDSRPERDMYLIRRYDPTPIIFNNILEKPTYKSSDWHSEPNPPQYKSDDWHSEPNPSKKAN